MNLEGERVLELEYPTSNTSYKVRKRDWSFDINMVLGDLNLDENIVIFDIIETINFINIDFGANPTPFHLYKSDLNRDGYVDIGDVILIIELIM